MASKDKIRNIHLNKSVYSNRDANQLVDRSFSELINISPNVNIKKFGEIYKELFYKIPKRGVRSHETLIRQSHDFIRNYINPYDVAIENWIEKNEKLDDILFDKETPQINEHPFYTNGTFLRTSIISDVINHIDDSPQGLPIWVMQDGAKREFKSFDTFLTAKRALGFSVDDKIQDIAEKLTFSQINKLDTGPDIENDNDLNLPVGIALTDAQVTDINAANYVDYYTVRVTCLEGTLEEPDVIGVDEDGNLYGSNQDVVTDFAGRIRTFVPGNTYNKRFEACRVGFYGLSGNKTSRGISPGSTTQPFRVRADQSSLPPDADKIGRLGFTNDYRDTGYIRIEYKEDSPVQFSGTSGFELSGSISRLVYADRPNTGEIMPKFRAPKYSYYGTRMFIKNGFGDHHLSWRSDISELQKENPDIFDRVFNDPSNVYYSKNETIEIEGPGWDPEDIKNTQFTDIYGSEIYYNIGADLGSPVDWSGGYFFVKGKLEKRPGPLNDRRYVLIVDKRAVNATIRGNSYDMYGKVAYFKEHKFNDYEWTMNGDRDSKRYPGLSKARNMAADVDYLGNPNY